MNEPNPSVSVTGGAPPTSWHRLHGTAYLQFFQIATDSLQTLLPALHRYEATLAYSGLRLSEALGLTWQEIDFEAEEIHVRHQLSKATREKPARRKPLKTDAARRDVVLLSQLATILKQHRKKLLAAGLYRSDGYVFCTQTGAPMYCRNVAERGVGKAGDRAGLNTEGKPRLPAHATSGTRSPRT